MRKFIFTTILILLSVCSFAYQGYWDKPLYIGGPNVNSLMAEMPYISDEVATLSKQYVADGALDVSVSMKLGWYNFYRINSQRFLWANWVVNGFSYERRVYYSPAGSESYQEFSELYVDNGYIDVSSSSEQAKQTIKVNSYSYCYNTFSWDESIHLDVKNLAEGKLYNLKIVYSFIPNVSTESSGMMYDESEASKYLQTQVKVINKSSTKSSLSFNIASFAAEKKSVINVNGFYNPFYNTGSGDIYLVYNDPGAIISVIADTTNLPYSKSVITTSAKYEKIGYGAFLASIGASSSPTDIKMVNTNTGCGVMYEQCSRTCNSVTNPNIEFLTDNDVQKKFLRNKGYDISTSCFHRWTNILQRSVNDDLTLYDERTINEFTQESNGNLRESKTYHLRDFSNVNKYSKESYGAGAILKIQHSTIYISPIDIVKSPKYKSFISLGYAYYGVSDDFNIGSGSGVVSNILNFEVVAKVYFPRLSSSDKAIKYICVSDVVADDSEFIHLKGKNMVCGNYSESIYSPEYVWEVSFDGYSWEILDKDNYSDYIIDRHDVQSALVIDASKDVLLKSTILAGKDYAFFRQRVILKAFASDEFTSLYNYDGKDGKYYISIKARDYYTYMPMPHLSEGNLLFSPSFPEEQRVCAGDNLSQKKISFGLTVTEGVSAEQINQVAEIADYKVYELKGGIPADIVSNNSSYVINWKGEDIGYRCVISWCNDSIYKDVFVYAADEERMNLDNITASSSITEVDKASGSVSVSCLPGTAPTITVKNEMGYEYYFRNTMSVIESSPTWNLFSEGNSTVLSNSGSDGVSDSYYVMKRNLQSGCTSDSVKIVVTYGIADIENNVIAFASATESKKSTVYVTKNTLSHKISGTEISGGYGVPTMNNRNVYAYRYIYREPNGVWQPLGDEIIVTGGESKELSLKNGALTIDRRYDIARIAMSRIGIDIASQVSDTSNILSFDIVDELSIDDVVIEGDGQCAGTTVSMSITGYKPSKEVRDATRYIWKTDDKNLNMVLSGDMDQQCDIYNSSKDFTVTVYREDTIAGSKTPKLEIPVKVSSVVASFSIVTDGLEKNIFDSPDEKFTYQSGTRFELKNQSSGADSYVWNLELQYYTGTEVEGLKSYSENPVCYLYNPGQNKIRLTAMNSIGCESVITAENIDIQLSSIKHASVSSYFEEDGVVPQSLSTDKFEVYPTVTSGESVKIYYPEGEFEYMLVSSLGQNITSGSADISAEIYTDGLVSGFYQLLLWPVDNSGKSVGSNIIKILKR